MNDRFCEAALRDCYTFRQVIGGEARLHFVSGGQGNLFSARVRRMFEIQY